MTKKIGRNDTCPCGSELKYKKCCMKKDDLERSNIKGNNQTLNAKSSIIFGGSPDKTSFFKSKEDIFSSIRSEGFIHRVEYEDTFEIEGELSTVMEVAMVCSHDYAEHSRTYSQLEDGTWEHTEDSWGTACPHCTIKIQ